jgi:hypothetical protein
VSQSTTGDADDADADVVVAAAAAPAAMIEDKEKMAEYESKMKKLFPKLKVRAYALYLIRTIILLQYILHASHT